MGKNSWHIIYTKARAEKKLASRLIERGYSVFFPTLTTVKQWSDRKKKVEEPLFRSYIFIYINETQRQEIVRYPGFVCFLHWLGKPAVLRENEVNSIKTFIGEIENQKTQVDLEYGDPLKIDWGIFNGQEGKYIARRGNQIILLVESLGQMVKATVPAQHVAKTVAKSA